MGPGMFAPGGDPGGDGRRRWTESVVGWALGEQVGDGGPWQGHEPVEFPAVRGNVEQQGGPGLVEGQRPPIQLGPDRRRPGSSCGGCRARRRLAGRCTAARLHLRPRGGRTLSTSCRNPNMPSATVSTSTETPTIGLPALPVDPEPVGSWRPAGTATSDRGWASPLSRHGHCSERARPGYRNAHRTTPGPARVHMSSTPRPCSPSPCGPSGHRMPHRPQVTGSVRGCRTGWPSSARAVPAAEWPETCGPLTAAVSDVAGPCRQQQGRAGVPGAWSGSRGHRRRGAVGWCRRWHRRWRSPPGCHGCGGRP